MNALTPKKMEQGSMVLPLLVSFLSALTMAFLLCLLTGKLGIHSLSAAWKLGSLVWFGFNFLPGLTQSLFNKRPLALLLIDSGHQMANIMIITWILMLWR